jgi:hypothetical protein
MIALAQQCICAIDLIGTQLLERDTEVSSLRRVRDDLLSTTEAGREWIALFERAQGRLVGIALGDERLAANAASLLESTAKLVEDDSSMVTDEDAERGRSLMRELADRSEFDDVKADLEAVSAHIAQMPGLTSREAIEMLMTRGPRR